MASLTRANTAEIDTPCLTLTVLPALHMLYAPCHTLTVLPVIHMLYAPCLTLTVFYPNTIRVNMDPGAHIGWETRIRNSRNLIWNV